jgi:hypothetical protein
MPVLIKKGRILSKYRMTVMAQYNTAMHTCQRSVFPFASGLFEQAYNAQDGHENRRWGGARADHFRDEIGRDTNNGDHGSHLKSSSGLESSTKDTMIGTHRDWNEALILCSGKGLLPHWKKHKGTLSRASSRIVREWR